MLKQNINGKTQTIYATGATESDLTDLLALLNGEVRSYEKKLEGGAESATPTVLNTGHFVVGKITSTGGRKSKAVFCPHLKSGKSCPNDVISVVTGVFDVDYDLTEKCEYVNKLV